MRREYHRWYSARVGRMMELLVFGHAGAKVLVFPTRDGRFYEYEKLRVVQQLAHKIEAGQLQLFCVDSLDHESLYCFWKHPAERIRYHIRFEEYILHEVLPFMQHKNHHPCTIAHGCSLGGVSCCQYCVSASAFIPKIGGIFRALRLDHAGGKFHQFV